MTIAPTRHGTELLSALSYEIESEHLAVKESLSDALEHAIRAGGLLLQAKEMIPFGSWDDWLSERASQWGMSIEWARSYMRLYRHQETIRAHQIKTITAARTFLISSSARDVRVDPTMRQECDRLRSLGYTQKQIAAELGVSQPTVWRWCNPEKELKYQRHRAKTSRAGRHALKVTERHDLARRHGGDLGDAYSYVRRTLDNLERASKGATAETRREIRSAMNSLYNAEDALARAIRLSYEENAA